MAGLPIFCDPDSEVTEELRAETGGLGIVLTSLSQLRDHVMGDEREEDTLVLGPGVSDGEAFAVAEYLRVERPTLAVIMVRNEVTTPLLQEALRAHVREVVDRRDTLGLQSAIKRSAHFAATMRDKTPPAPALLSGGQPRARGRVITMFSAKGGCGKTMLATNLGAALADNGLRRVVIVDLDLTFGDVAVAMKLLPARTIMDAVPLNGKIDSAAVLAMLTPHSRGLDVIVAPTEPSAAESIPPTLVSHLLDVLTAEFDFVVVDTPPRFDDQVLAALDVSDQIALLATPDVPALKNLNVTLGTLVELGYPRDKFRLILNRADAKVGISLAEVEKAAQMSISAEIPGSRDVPASINRGVPIVLEQARHPVSQAIRRFAEHEVIRVANGQNERIKGPTQRRGWRKRRPG